jgi:hypothetical protein
LAVRQPTERFQFDSRSGPPGGHSPGFGAYEEGRDKAVDRDNQPTIS